MDNDEGTNIGNIMFLQRQRRLNATVNTYYFHCWGRLKKSEFLGPKTQQIWFLESSSREFMVEAIVSFEYGNDFL